MFRQACLVVLTALLAGGAPRVTAASAAPGATGPWAVGHRQLAAVDASRADRPLPLEVWYPVDAADAHGTTTFYALLGPIGITSTLALEGVPVSGAGRRPLVVFSHGSGGLAIQSIKLMEHLASHGFVVVAPNHTGNTQADGQAGTAVPLAQALLDRSPDVSFVIDEMTRHDADPLDPFSSRIDAQNVGVAGHSLGGFTAVAMASGYGAIPPDPRVRAIMPIAPASSYITQAELAGITIPTLLMTGTLDGLLAQQIRIFGLIHSGPFRYRVDVIGATHTHFANICDIANALISVGFTENLWPAIGAGALVGPYHATCVPPAFSIDEATRIQNLYAAAFFRRHLLADTSYDAFLTAAYAQASEPNVAFFDPPLQAVSVDPYLCYRAASAPGDPPLATSLGSPILTDQLVSRAYDAVKVVSLCAPATSTFNGVTVSPALPTVHQQGYSIKRQPGAPRIAQSDLTVTDMFGTLTVRVTGKEQLLVRARKVDLGTTFTRCRIDAECGDRQCIGGACVDPVFASAPSDAAGVDNFKCYRVTVTGSHFTRITGGLVQLQDQFGGPLAYDVNQPRRWCAPVDMNGENPSAETHQGHLMCYRVKLTPRSPAQPGFAPHRVAIANTSFPNARLEAIAPSELCVPAS